MVEFFGESMFLQNMHLTTKEIAGFFDASHLTHLVVPHVKTLGFHADSFGKQNLKCKYLVRKWKKL